MYYTIYQSILNTTPDPVTPGPEGEPQKPDIDHTQIPDQVNDPRA